MLEDGYYRIIPKEGTSYDIVRVYSGSVDMSESTMPDNSVEYYLGKGYSFTRVYPIHLPEELYERVHDEALAVGLSDDDVIKTALNSFLI